MASSWDDVKTSMKSFFSSAADKTEEYARIGKIKVDIVNLKRSLDRQYQEMGKTAYNALKSDNQTILSGRTEIQKLMADIQKRIDDIKAREKEIEKIRAEADSRKKAVKKEAKKEEKKEPGKEAKKASGKATSSAARKTTSSSGKSVKAKETAADKKPAPSGPEKDS